MTSSCRPGAAARSFSVPSRLALGTSTGTTKSTSRRIPSGLTSKWPPGNAASGSGSVAGAAKLTSTRLPLLSSTKASASPAPMVSASGWTWAITAIVAASDSNSTAPRASTRAPAPRAPESSVFASIAVTATLTRFAQAAVPVWIGVPGRLGAGANARHIGIRRAGTGEQLVHPLHAVGRRVPGKCQSRREAHPRTRADPGPERALGPLQRGRGRPVIRLVLQRAPHHRVEHRRVVQVGGDLRVDDGHPVQPGILDLELDR